MNPHISRLAHHLFAVRPPQFECLAASALVYQAPLFTSLVHRPGFRRIAATVPGYTFGNPLSFESEAKALGYIRAVLETSLKEAVDE